MEEKDDSKQGVANDSDHWLAKMEGYLDWKIIAPMVNNPFQTPIPDRTLAQMLSQKETVLKMLSVRCLCDGHEVLRIENLQSPIVTTNHPCLTSLQRPIILDHMSKIGVDEEIELAVDRVQDTIREELARREKKDREVSPSGQKTLAQIKAEKKKKEDAERAKLSGPRVIHR